MKVLGVKIWLNLTLSSAELGEPIAAPFDGIKKTADKSVKSCSAVKWCPLRDTPRLRDHLTASHGGNWILKPPTVLRTFRTLHRQCSKVDLSPFSSVSLSLLTHFFFQSLRVLFLLILSICVGYCWNQTSWCSQQSVWFVSLNGFVRFSPVAWVRSVEERLSS